LSLAASLYSGMTFGMLIHCCVFGGWIYTLRSISDETYNN
jgi:hypothetical protein